MVPVYLKFMCMYYDTWDQTHDLRLTAYITSVLWNRLLYEEKISYSNIDFESSRMRVKSTRSMVRLQCRTGC
jgi:hypothetical protein